VEGRGSHEVEDCGGVERPLRSVFVGDARYIEIEWDEDWQGGGQGRPARAKWVVVKDQEHTLVLDGAEVDLPTLPV